MIINKYYITKLLFNNKERYLIYVPCEKDYYLSDERGDMLVFCTLLELKEYAENEKLPIDAKAAEILCVDKLVDNGKPTDEVLNFWNVCTDIAYTVGEQFLGDKRKPIINTVYFKLFAGSDVPAIRGDNPPYFPIWTWRERRVANKVLTNGIELVKKYVFRG